MAELKTKVFDSTIFITGGAGFIGSYVVEELLPLNPKKIIIVDNFIRGSEENMSSFINDSRIEFHKEDIRNTELLEDCISRSDYVFHMAALRINACAADQKEGFDVMLASTFNVIDLCRKHNVKKIIYSSSASIYGLAQNFPTPESDNPYDNQTFYGAAKMWGEQLLRSYKFMHNLDYVGLRYFNVYGQRMDTEGKYTEVMIKWLDCVRDKRAPLISGDGSTSMDFIHVHDIAKANVLALLSEITDKVYNVGSGCETSLKELLELLLSVNNSDLAPKYIEANSINPVSRRLASIDVIKQDLGFEPTLSLEEGLELLSNWYFEKQAIKA